VEGGSWEVKDMRDYLGMIGDRIKILCGLSKTIGCFRVIQILYLNRVRINKIIQTRKSSD
jgi:hypothetical protein